MKSGFSSRIRPTSFISDRPLRCICRRMGIRWREYGGDCASAAMSSSAALAAPAIIGSKIHKKFPRDKGEAMRALENVSFEVRRGALTALVAPTERARPH